MRGADKDSLRPGCVALIALSLLQQQKSYLDTCHMDILLSQCKSGLIACSETRGRHAAARALLTGEDAPCCEAGQDGLLICARASAWPTVISSHCRRL